MCQLVKDMKVALALGLLYHSCLFEEVFSESVPENQPGDRGKGGSKRPVNTTLKCAT